jgi:thiol-disulfide isomerase/thioredoxin
MKIVKISAIWCGGCLVMNKVWKKLKENFDYEFIELDYDMDEEEVQKYSPGELLPVFIIYNEDKEVERITGELSYEEMLERIKEVGVCDE